MTQADWFLLLLAPIMGSMLGVLVRRGPVLLARSQCEVCGHVLGPADLVPLLSFLLLRGRCRHCGARIGWFHPAIELAALAVALAALWAGGEGARPWIGAALGWALLGAAWIDAETFRLPDLATLPLILAGLGATWALAPDALYDHALAAAAGYAGFRLLDAAYFAVRRRHGLGQGDAKLLAAAGAWLGLAALPYVVMGAGLVGIAVALATGGWRGEQKLAFGPALAGVMFLGFLSLPFF